MIRHHLRQIKNNIENLDYKFLQFNKVELESVYTHINNLLKAQYEYIAIIGFGASSLNFRALASLVSISSNHVIYLDSLDLLDIEQSLCSVEISKTIFFAISHSGNTHETYYLTKYLLDRKQISAKNFYIISPKTNNLMFNLALKHSVVHVEHPSFESGRFGIISAASLIPLGLLGVNIEDVINIFQSICINIWQRESELEQEIDWYLTNYNNGKNIMIMFNYSYQLHGLALWKQQVFAESLGKNGFGFSLIIARGTFDEHSQLQLYLNGPDDKFYHIMHIKANDELAKQNELHVSNSYQALINYNKQVKITSWSKMDINTLGQEIISTMIIIICIAKIQNINPFDQPIIDFYKKNYNSTIKC